MVARYMEGGPELHGADNSATDKDAWPDLSGSRSTLAASKLHIMRNEIPQMHGHGCDCPPIAMFEAMQGVTNPRYLKRSY